MSWTDLAQYTPHGLIAVVATVVGYIGRQHFKDDKEVAARVSTLEINRVVKADMDRIYDRLNDVNDKMAEGQREILLAIASRRPPSV